MAMKRTCNQRPFSEALKTNGLLAKRFKKKGLRQRVMNML
jgi:hypothetical protein